MVGLLLADRVVIFYSDIKILYSFEQERRRMILLLAEKSQEKH